MNLLMLTNTYAPHVGGVARSVEAFANEYRRRGHRVLVVAPQFEGAPPGEKDVIRIPAIQRFNGSDFSVRIPIPGLLSSALAEFRPDLVHSHHPFLLGDTAVRVAAAMNRPLVFTHHTMYERYTHYVPGDSPRMARFVMRLATGYANLCDLVFAPSQSVAAILRQRGVLTPIEVVPTGVDVERFAQGDRDAMRCQAGIAGDAFVIGHVGRLAPEKNLGLLAAAVARVVRKYPHVHFLVVGAGPSEPEIVARFERLGLTSRLHLLGTRSGQDLIDAYHAMDVFAFASLTETQGMVLTEAMSAGVPVVAIDAPGAREVVIDGRNGRLLRRQNAWEFARALEEIITAPGARRAALREASRQTGRQFSMPRCAAKALDHYATVLAAEPRAKNFEHSAWESTFRWIASEWDLWTNLLRSATGALRPRGRWRIPGWRFVGRAWQRLVRWFSRSEWGIRVLRLPVCENVAAEPGLILVQIDGLSRTQFERALARGRLPFLRRLLRREHYQLESFYSGLPSSTPGVQGELFYGVRTVVPAFSFRDPEAGRIVRMYEADVAAQVERRLERQGRGLLEGGSVYADMYTGGADEAHFCAPSLGWGRLLRGVHPLLLVVLLVWHLGSALRVAGLVLLEILLAVTDFARGLLAGRSFTNELKFIPSRVAVSVLLRELITIGATLDATRGLPVIHLNFLGYDEQAHRRGPNSRFAHWSLKGIDGCLRRIWRAARRSKRRDYQVWIYSDHGQESTTSYVRKTGRWLDSVVADLWRGRAEGASAGATPSQNGEETRRAAWLGGGWFQRLLPSRSNDAWPAGGDEPLVAAMGPLAHVYAPRPISDEERAALARQLVTEHAVPVVYALDGQGSVLAYTTDGCFRLPEQASNVLGDDHPFLKEVAGDLVDLCRNRYAGDLVLSGWKRGVDPLTFPRENGSHAGPGAEETRGFALLPLGVCLPDTRGGPLRPEVFRAAALHVLGRAPLKASRRLARPRPDPETVRVMTYNVRGCLGVDGRLSPERIARLIAQYEPDIVALQALDVGQGGCEEVDQAHEIARDLNLEFHWHPPMGIAEEGGGNAILTPHPMRVIRADRLPSSAGPPDAAPRGALWVEVDLRGHGLQVLNTRLGPRRPDRHAQVAELLGPGWLGGPQRRGPLVLCGDLNASPRSRAYRLVARQLRDVQAAVASHRPRRTFPSRYPVSRVDHVFVSGGLDVVRTEVPRTDLARRASDHLPLVVDLRLPPHRQAPERSQATRFVVR